MKVLCVKCVAAGWHAVVTGHVNGIV